MRNNEDVPLLEKLLGEIVSKYKSGHFKDSAYLARLEKTQMVKEIRLLVKALINSEKTVKVVTEKLRAQVKAFKCDKLETDFRLSNSQRRENKLTADNIRLCKQIQDLEEAFNENEREIKSTYIKFDSAREQYSCDKRELLLKLEKEK